MKLEQYKLHDLLQMKRPHALYEEKDYSKFRRKTFICRQSLREKITSMKLDVLNKKKKSYTQQEVVKLLENIE